MKIVMKITIYTITNCPFSKQEKEYLRQNNLEFEEKDLEKDKKYLAEMLTVSNNFAGTPVTKIEKDDGQTVILKGFTKTEFDKELGLLTTPPQSIETVSTVSPTPTPTPTPTPPALSETPPSPPTPPTPPVTEPEPTLTPVEPSLTTKPESVNETSPQVDDLLAQLKSKASLNPVSSTSEPTPTIDPEPVLSKPPLETEPSVMPPAPVSNQESVSNSLSSNNPLSKIDIPDIK